MKEGKELAKYTLDIGESVKFDFTRERRKGFPEIVLSTGKSDSMIVSICRGVVKSGEPVIISRIDAERAGRLTDLLRQSIHKRGEMHYYEDGRIFFVRPAGWKIRSHRGAKKAAIVTGGSADIRVASETSAILEILGYAYDNFFDCGIAGLHRSIEAARRIQNGDYGIAIVFAGMEGALASVMASLLSIPVIGVPVSAGYGAGGDGSAALHSMLQSCIPGLSVVNIDNGVGAAASAVAILGLTCRN